MMPEILTESFCERCGTRYTFESTAPRKTRRLGQFKTLSKGMKNWVMSDDTSLDEAMAAARSDEERELTSQQLDAFHSTFNFCMNCRQYTCSNCWNGAEGRCLSCAPHLGQDVLGTPFPEAAPFEPARIEAEAWPEIDLGALAGDGNGNGSHGIEGWGDAADPGIEEIDPAARLAFLSGEAPAPALASEPSWPAEATAEVPAATTEPGFEAVLADRSAVAPASEPEPAASEPVAAASERDEAAAASEPALAASAPIAETLPDSVEDRAVTGTQRTSELLRRFRPGQSLDAELEAYEAELARQEAEAAVSEPEAAVSEPEASVSEPVAATSEPVATVTEPEPVAAEAAVEPPTEPAARQEVAAVAAEPAPDVARVPEPEPELVAASATPEPEPAPDAEPVREDRIEQPTWRIYAPDSSQPGLPAAAAPSLPPAPPSNGTPQWPVNPEQVESPAMALLLNRGIAANSDVWAASSREVLAQPAGGQPGAAPGGVQPCSNCGLSLSATARFCRRCGTRQG
jgi:hypothetical protein